ncbi:MAG TPA: penicillin-binding transpeptidase domain-containing protein [Thermoanaerobaculia bacterium]|nr:penicillin-binding transpeptidase domain-containing protein [Thermoanaerobaculia bacterium]
MNLNHRRLLQLFAILAAWAFILLARLGQVQVVQHDTYVARAQRQQERTLSLEPVRGSILDARGRVLAESVAAVSVYADPQAITDIRGTARALARVAGVDLDAKEIEARLHSDGAFVWIVRQAPVETGAAIRDLHLPGIFLLDSHRRTYPRGQLAANVIGFLGLDGQGLAGIEHSFDGQMRGRAGRVTLLRDARHGMYLVGGEGPNRPVDGDDVVLTIDSVVQFITEQALGEAVTKWHAAGGTAIVIDPNDGSILAMASMPTFDPNDFGDFPQIAWRNRAVQEIYEPGSTFKIVTASAGLQEGVVTPSQIIDCGNGGIQVGNVEIHEHGGNRYGLMSFEQVMLHSSNVGAIHVGLSLGDDRFYRYIRRFGFGERTGIQLPGESPGLLRRVARWSQVSAASISMGQEIGVTPLQIAEAFATVANGGVRVAPRIVDRVVDAKGDVVDQPQKPEPVRVISEKTAAVLNEILKAVVERGTGEHAGLEDHIVAGKTGTAQVAIRGGYSPDKFVASFGGYVPADRPKLAIIVVVDEPKGAEYGGTVAAPVFKEIAEPVLHYLGVPPSVPARTLHVAPPLLAAFSQESGSSARGGGGRVPDMRGMDARAAVASATAAGLQVRTTGSGVVQSQIQTGDVLLLRLGEVAQ